MLSNTDIRILAQLRKDGRMKLTKMSENIQVPVTTIYGKIKSFEQRHIRKYAPLLDFAALGYNVKVQMVISVANEGREKLRNYLLVHTNVNTLQKVNFSSDFLAECIFTTIPELEKFTLGMEKRFPIKGITRFHITEELKQEDFLADERHISTGEKQCAVSK